MGLRRDFRADGLAHAVAVLQHIGQFEVAQASHCGIADVGGKGAARVCVFEKKRDRIADKHFVPDADTHGRALF